MTSIRKWWLEKFWPNTKREVNALLGRARKQVGKIDYVHLIKDGATWLIEAFIIGIPTAYAAHILVRWPMTLTTIMAHGALISQSLYVVKRIRKKE
jgi:hypothetical protein